MVRCRWTGSLRKTWTPMPLHGIWVMQRRSFRSRLSPTLRPVGCPVAPGGCPVTSSLNGPVEEAATFAKNVVVWLKTNATEMSFLRQFDCSYSLPLAPVGFETLLWRYSEHRPLKVSSETADLSNSPFPSA